MGNPGKGAVFILTALISFVLIVISFPLIIILLPVAFSVSKTLSKWFGITGPIVILDKVAADAIKKVPASILSGITLCLQPLNFSTPSIIIF